jgi:hypothetical protein
VATNGHTKSRTKGGILTMATKKKKKAAAKKKKK